MLCDGNEKEDVETTIIPYKSQELKVLNYPSN
jgi:hypothetical protein